MSSKISSPCDNCVISQLCTQDAPEPIKQKCISLKLSKRFLFANNQCLVKFEEIFTEIFWNYQDFNALLLHIDLIKKAYENNKITLSKNKNFVKDQMFIEIIVKFCKLAEDFGGLASSKDQDLFKFAQNFNKFGVGQAKSFYKNLNYTNKRISEIFSYPQIHKQKNEEAKKFLKLSNEHLRWWLSLIKEKYLLYIEVYNSYKHGYRIRFGNVPVTINDNPKNNDFKDIKMNINDKNMKYQYSGIAKYADQSPHKSTSEFKSNKVLMFYNLKMLNKYPFCPGMIAYSDGFGKRNFYDLYDSCVALIKMMEIFLNNFMNSIRENSDNSILLFGIDDKELLKVNLNEFV